MQQFIIPVNNEALARAMVALHGTEGAELIGKAYRALDEAMKFAYDTGIAEGAIDRATAAKEYGEALARADADNDQEDSFKDGYDAGYDDGYLDGVEDARDNGDLSDEYIDSLSEDEASWYEGDSGDETDDLYHTWDPIQK